MKKSNKTARETRLEEQVKQLKAENKKMREREKYAKVSKAELKAELKRVTAERDAEVKKLQTYGRSQTSSIGRTWRGR